MTSGYIKRHTGSAIFMHWFNAICWLLLLITGLGLIRNETLSPVGMWLPNLMQLIFGKGAVLFNIHVIIGIIWAVVFLLYALINPKQNLFRFIKEVFAISPSRDIAWLFKKGIMMTLGKKQLQKLGHSPQLPPQGFYNVGQKLFAIPSLLGGIVIVLTGVLMLLSKFVSIAPGVVQWSIVIHFITVGLVFAGLLIHIYMAAIDPGERPAFKSMFSGEVPESFAKHHNAEWYQGVQQNRYPN